VRSGVTNRRLLASLVLGALAAFSCGDGEEAPESDRLPNAASYIPAAPAPQPTATPPPGETDAVVPSPANPSGDRGATAGCGQPVPPPVSRFNVKVHGQQAGHTLLDATPLVGPDVLYCAKIGYADGRSFCPVRPEGHPERVACETARVGRASDTGRPGPTWSADGKRCNGPDSGASCLNHPDNQYLAYAYGAGTFRACGASGVCGELALP
jgi:hypothetical protein